MPKSKCSSKIGSRYRGVIQKNEDEWNTCISFKKRRHLYGPFRTEVEAAMMYDKKAKFFFKEKAVLNFKPEEEGKRKKFPQVTRNRICSLQKWKCNFCQELLGEDIIVDHMVPLFLGGPNFEYNLQALCSSCDKFKTSYIDWQILRQLSEQKMLMPQDVKEVQRNNYYKMKCVEPGNFPETTKDESINMSRNDEIILNIRGIKIHIKAQ